MIPIAYIRIGCQWSPMFFLSLHLLRLRWTELRRGSKRLECEARIVKYGRKRGKRTAAVTSIVVFPSWHFHWIFMVQNIKRINPPALLMCIALPLKQGVPCFVLGVQNVAKQRWKQKETNWNDMYNSNRRLQTLLTCFLLFTCLAHLFLLYENYLIQ